MKKLLLCLLLLSSLVGFAQTIPSGDEVFPLGTWATGAPMDDPVQYDSIKAAGFNWIVQSVNNTTKPLLTDFNIITQNASAGEWIYYYSNGKYKRWEAERSEYAFLATGMKHPPTANAWSNGPYRFGNSGSYDGDSCWITHDTLTTFVDSVLWGPNYSQAKNYKMSYNKLPVDYTVKYRLALNNPYTDPQDTICYLYIRYRYLKVHGSSREIKDTIITGIHLLAQDFADTNWTIKTLQYRYPSEFLDSTLYKMGDYPDDLTYYISDTDTLTGIEYCLDYWGKTGRKLYMDYVEVYDNEIWIDWIDEPTLVMSRIDSQLTTYPPSQWQNLKYWYVSDEPPSLDEYEPIRIVDSLVYALSGYTWRTINQFHPGWNGHSNGDKSIKRYKELAGQERLMIDYFPFWENETDEFGFRHIRPILEQAAEYAPGFFYVPQGFGQFVKGSNFTEVCGWREPSPEELKASILFALSFGAKGIHIWKFATNLGSSDAGNCDTTVQWKCLADMQSNNYTLFPLGQIIRDDVATRLNGVLGNKLLYIDYAKIYATYKQYSQVVEESATGDFLTLSQQPPVTMDDFNFHAGLLYGNDDDDYFLLTNLLTAHERRIRINLTKPDPSFVNYRVKDIERDYKDFSFTTGNFSLVDTLPGGEGRLYIVAPVIKHGGLLTENETVNNYTLYDDMTIENGATLYVDGNYTCKGNITLKDGGSIVNSGNGQLLFQDGKRIIVEGSAVISGTTGDHLVLDFNGTGATDGITLKDGANLSISNVDIKECRNGITTLSGGGEEPLWWYLNADSVFFSNCTNSAFNLYKVEGGFEIPTIPSISYCQVTGSQYGISAFNMPSIRIEYNQLTNTLCGINLSQIPSVEIVNNSIITNLSISMPGIIMSSSSGNIRGNTIKYHQEGINLGNSSPSIGGNTIEQNKRNGIYVGIGSNPDLSPEIAGSPPIYYPISGYNVIKENGNESGYDESEIYLNSSEILLDEGCNEIRDDREPLLVETKNLMNGENVEVELLATYNIWGDNSTDPLSQRFGDLTVIYDPYYTEPCPFPQSPGGREMVLMDAGGEVTDTIYSVEGTPNSLSQTELSYAVADEQFLTGDLTSAKTSYEEITGSEATSKEKRKAYEQLY